MRLKCYKEDVYEGVAANDHAPDYNPNPPVFACKFSCSPGHEHVLALANEDGKIALQDTSAKNKFQGPLEGTQVHTLFFKYFCQCSILKILNFFTLNIIKH